MAATDVVEIVSNRDGSIQDLWFWCPGCKTDHAYRVKGPNAWQWNGSLDKPTVMPSLMVWRDNPEKRCHLYVSEGSIQFLSDSHHDLKDETVVMKPLDSESPQ